MSFLSGLGHILKGVGHLITGDDDEEKKRQQQALRDAAPTRVTPQVVQPSPAQPQAPTPIGDLLQQPLKKAVGPIPALGPNQPQPNPNYQPPPQPEAPPQKAHASIIHNITHNPVTNTVGNIGKGVYHDAADAVDVVNAGRQGVGGLIDLALHPAQQNEILRKTQAATDYSLNASHGLVSPDEASNASLFGSKAEREKFVNPVARGALRYAPYAVAPELGKIGGELGAKTAAAALPKATSRYLGASLLGLPSDVAEQAAGQTLKKATQYGAVATASGLINTGFGGSGDIRSGMNPGEVLQKVPENFGVGGFLGLTGAGLADAGGALRKAVASQKPAEISPGITSTNPTHLEDAIKQTTEPAPQAPLPADAPVVEPPQPLVPHAMSSHELDALNVIEKASKERILTTQEQAMRQELQAKKEAITSVNNPEPVAEPPVKPTSAKDSKEVPVAPNAHDAAVGQLVDKELQKAFKGVYKTREKIDINALHEDATNSIDKMPPGEIATRYSGVTELNSPQEFINAVHALKVLGDSPVTEASTMATGDLMTAIDNFQSKSGQNLRVGQVLWDNMPRVMKTATLVNRLKRNDIEITAKQEEKLDSLLQASEDVSKKRNAAESALAEIEAGIRDKTLEPGTPSVTDRIATLAKEYDASLREHEFADGAAADYYRSLLPKGALGDRLAQDARVFMLSAPTGRAHDFISTGGVVGVDLATDVVQSGLNKVVNTVRGNKDALSTAPSLKKYGQGLVTGLKDSGRAIFSGQHRVSDFQGTVKKAPNRSNIDPRGTVSWKNPLKKVANISKNITVGLTEAPTFITQGKATAKLYQLAVQDGKKEGLSGQSLKNFAEVNSRLRSKADQLLAQQEHLKVNNLHRNGVAQLTTGIVQAAQNAAKGHKLAENIVPQIINQIAPFTSWVSGNVNRTLTDANMFSNLTRLAQSVGRRDTEGATKAAAQLTTNGGLFAAGLLLTANGSIVDHDANGKNYAGAYFKIGNRYVPLAILGPFAAPLLFGSAAHHASQKEGGLSPKNLLGALGEGMGNTVKSLGVSSTFGGSSALQSGIANIGTGQQSVGDAAAKVAAGAVGQYIPGATRDINSYIDTHTGLNPTREAPDTKAYKKNAKGNNVVDRPKTAINQVQSAIPGLSQQLPRKAGVPARDLTDRALQGTHETPKMATERVQKEITTKKNLDQASDFKQRDIPNFHDKGFDEAVKARFERGEYDKSIEALQAKLDNQKTDKNTAESSNKALEDSIKLYQVHKAGKFDPGVADLYKKTDISEWRNLGDPKSDAYDPSTYQRLFEYDSARAKAGISKSTLSENANAYTAKKGSGSSASSGSSALSKIRSNTLGSTPALKAVSFGGLAPKKVTTATIPTIQQIKAGDLIKKRAISVSKR